MGTRCVTLQGVTSKCGAHGFIHRNTALRLHVFFVHIFCTCFLYIFLYIFLYRFPQQVTHSSHSPSPDLDGLTATLCARCVKRYFFFPE